MKEIITYHNDFNRISIPHFNELEQDLLFGIFYFIKNFTEDDTIAFSAEDLKKISLKHRIKDEEFKKIMVNLFENFLKADFKILIKKEKLIGESIINLFKKVIFWYAEKDVKQEKIIGIELELNTDFKYLILEVTSNFTAFELLELIELSGKYTKTLYRQLKQFRGTGFLKMQWEEFIRVMGIPKDYKQCDIDKRIIKPAIAELTKERTLFDQVRVPFENLTYEKIKDKSQRGRGGKIVAIVFNFKKQGDCIDVRTKDEKIEDLRVENSQLIQEKATVTIENNALKEKNEALKKVVGELQDQNFKMNFKEYTAMRVESDNYGDTSEIIKVEKNKNEADLNSKVNYYIMVTLKNLRSGKEWNAEFKDINNFRNYLIKHSVLDETKMHNIAIADHRKININFR